MILILIGGGNASGKQTYCQMIKEGLLTNDSSLKVREINLESEYYTVNDGEKYPLKAEQYQFEQLLKDIESFTEDVVLIHGIYVLYNKALRLKLSLKLFIDCDNDTRLTRFLMREKDTPSHDQIKKMIDVHLQTRSDLIGRFDSDVIIKTDLTDGTKSKTSMELIMNFLMDQLDTNDGKGLDKGEINLRENIERFYELN